MEETEIIENGKESEYEIEIETIVAEGDIDQEILELLEKIKEMLNHD